MVCTLFINVRVQFSAFILERHGGFAFHVHDTVLRNALVVLGDAVAMRGHAHAKFEHVRCQFGGQTGRRVVHTAERVGVCVRQPLTAHEHVTVRILRVKVQVAGLHALLQVELVALEHLVRERTRAAARPLLLALEWVGHAQVVLV